MGKSVWLKTVVLHRHCILQQVRILLEPSDAHNIHGYLAQQVRQMPLHSFSGLQREKEGEPRQTSSAEW